MHLVELKKSSTLVLISATSLSVKERNGGHFSLSRISTTNRTYVLGKVHSDKEKEKHANGLLSCIYPNAPL